MASGNHSSGAFTDKPSEQTTTWRDGTTDSTTQHRGQAWICICLCLCFTKKLAQSHTNNVSSQWICWHSTSERKLRTQRANWSNCGKPMQRRRWTSQSCWTLLLRWTRCHTGSDWQERAARSSLVSFLFFIPPFFLYILFLTTCFFYDWNSALSIRLSLFVIYILFHIFLYILLFLSFFFQSLKLFYKLFCQIKKHLFISPLVLCLMMAICYFQMILEERRTKQTTLQ